MVLYAHFFESPNGPVVIAKAEPLTLMDSALADRIHRILTNRLGGMPVVLRCQLHDTFLLRGDRSLYRYAVDPAVDMLPLVRLDLEPKTAQPKADRPH
jgi:hypothetical protein